MLVHPWDATLDEAEWREWLASTDRFGVLAVNNLDPAHAPIVVPTHFTAGDGELLVHLARPNPVWAHLEAASEVRLTVIGDYAYIPSYWRTKADDNPEHGVPTSYYSAVQFLCRPNVVDDADAKAAILTTQLGDFQPEGGHATVSAADPPYGRMLAGIRGLRLDVVEVEAKFKYDDQKPVEYRERVIDQLQQRGRPVDGGAAAQQGRRLNTVGEWRPRTDPQQPSGERR